VRLEDKLGGEVHCNFFPPRNVYNSLKSKAYPSPHEQEIERAATGEPGQDGADAAKKPVKIDL